MVPINVIVEQLKTYDATLLLQLSGAIRFFQK